MIRGFIERLNEQLIETQVAGCERRDGSDACCASQGYVLACVHAHRLSVARTEAIAFDVCRRNTEASSAAIITTFNAVTRDVVSRYVVPLPADALAHVATCWRHLPVHAYAEARVICAHDGGVWCGGLEDVRREQASGPTLVIAAVGAAVCYLALRRRMRRLGMIR